MPTYLYVLNTSIEALHSPQWARVPHNTELLWLTGAPFMDVGMFFPIYICNLYKLYVMYFDVILLMQNSFRKNGSCIKTCGLTMIVT